MSMELLKTILKWLLLGVLVLILGGIGGVFFERALVPKLASTPVLSGLPFLRAATENVTIIQRTEQLTVREDDTVERIVSQPATAVVNIVATAKPATAADAVTHTGTGVLVTNDGLVATYITSIIDSEDVQYTILLFDGSSHPAELRGVDPLTNLAFLKVNNVNTPAIALSNSDDARVGRKLVAIGNSGEEYRSRLSLGILGNIDKVFNLSGKTVASSEKWEGVFDMDMPRPEAYVGGPAIGYNGEMVGLMGAVMTDGLSRYFLIPSNAVREAMNLAIAGRFGERPTLGVYYLPLTKAYALAHDLGTRDRGALVFSPSGRTGLAVLSGSPAERANIQANDIIIAVNGQEVNLANPLSRLVARFKKGDKIELLVLRGANELKIPVQL